MSSPLLEKDNQAILASELTQRKTSNSANDVEDSAAHDPFDNTLVKEFSWKNVCVNVTDRATKQPKNIVLNNNGVLLAGDLLAIMGPSGSGKTSLLNCLANRVPGAGITTTGELLVNDTRVPTHLFSRISCYVEQDDALTGSLTVKETLSFAARLSLPSTISKAERLHRVDELIKAFGLKDQQDSLIGTPIRRGVSGGQKRRVSVAAQLVTGPKLLFLDEPTSGLDSAASLEVISYIKSIAKRHKLIVIASIHQPSSATFNLFDKLLLLSQGRTVYSGTISNLNPYFEQCGHPLPHYVSPAEFLLDLVNTDFADDVVVSNTILERLFRFQETSLFEKSTASRSSSSAYRDASEVLREDNAGGANKYLVPLTLIHRSFIKSYRDVIAYGIRLAMYFGLAIMMGTVWLRLEPEQKNIQSFTNAIFFGGAFMSFMAVAYIPAFLEDRALYIKERHNGLYGPTAFMVANFIVGIPYLFLISVFFSTIAYWLSNFQPTAKAFLTWILWLFLDLLAAESLVVLISSVVPIFVVALAAVAFANGLWMCVNGFMVSPNTLNVFWRYVFHYIDYQAYVFQGMMINEFSDRVYHCERSGDGCSCLFQSRLADQCQIDGKVVLDQYGYGTDNLGKLVGIMLAIVFVYRLLGWAVLHLRRT